jgi:hypothetical protein
MRRRMQPRQLKRLIETGHYRPEPGLIAEAMLQRRSVRELLTGPAAITVSATGRSRSPSAVPRQAA